MTDPLVWMNKYGHVASFKNEEYTVPLYTEPPKREWVGLTDEERQAIAKEKTYWDQIAVAVEAKLKEKNT